VTNLILKHSSAVLALLITIAVGASAAAAVVVLDPSPAQASGQGGSASTDPASDVGDVPAASCGPGSLPETGLQGEVPLVDQLDGRARQGYRCNLALVGQSPPAPLKMPFIMSAFLGNCAYLSTVTANLGDSELAGLNTALRGGVLVQDFSNPSHPVTTEELTTPAMQDPWESLKADPQGLIAAVGIQSSSFALYDGAKDCAHPTLEANTTLPDGFGHAGSFSPDGRFYYATDPPSLTGAVPDPERLQIVDVSDPSHPKLVLSWVPPTNMYVHDVTIAPNGDTAYFAVNGVGAASTGQNPVGAGRNGLLVVDTSQVQEGLPNPKLSIIGQVHWDDDNGANQAPVLARIGGKPYVIVTDEGGNVDFATSTGCPMTNPLGYPRIISLANPADPAIVGTLRLQAQDPANCGIVLKDRVPYPSHYCTVDNPQNATAIACTYWGSGLRVFDIRDPAHPREIAYYNPPDTTINALDLSLSVVRFDAATNELWFSNEQHGIQIVKFTGGAYPFAPAVKQPVGKPKRAKSHKRSNKKHKRARR
jgi:hypothetical protein